MHTPSCAKRVKPSQAFSALWDLRDVTNTHEVRTPCLSVVATRKWGWRSPPPLLTATHITTASAPHRSQPPHTGSLAHDSQHAHSAAPQLPSCAVETRRRAPQPPSAGTRAAYSHAKQGSAYTGASSPIARAVRAALWPCCSALSRPGRPPASCTHTPANDAHTPRAPAAVALGVAAERDRRPTSVLSLCRPSHAGRHTAGRHTLPAVTAGELAGPAGLAPAEPRAAPLPWAALS